MQALQLIQTTASQWGLQLPVHSVLRSPCVEYKARQGQSQDHACLHCSVQRISVARGNFVVREPDQDETPLSESEKQIAEREGWDG